MTEGESCESSVAVYPGLLRVHITSDGNDYIYYIYSNDIHKIPSLMLKTISVGVGLLTVLILRNLFENLYKSSPSKCFSSHKSLQFYTFSKEREKVLTFP